MANVLVVHGGGPTAVINASLYGVIAEAAKNREIEHVYGAIGGSEAIFQERFLDLAAYPEEKLKLLLTTPATAIGSSRYALEQEDYEAMTTIFQKHDIKYVLLNGGNGTMDTCGKIHRACKDAGICVVGIPKTIDNDIAITDHTPGYGSAARYLAETVAEVGRCKVPADSCMCGRGHGAECRMDYGILGTGQEKARRCAAPDLSARTAVS